MIQAYTRRRGAAYVLLRVEDRAEAKRWIAAQLAADHIPTAGLGDRRKPEDPTATRLCIAFTWEGLHALGFPDEDPEFEGFVGEFREGMVAKHRSRILGDSGANAPAHWCWGGPGDGIHLLLIVFAPGCDEIEEHWRRVEAGLRGLAKVHRVDGYLNEEGTEHFGFRDGISQPYIEGSDTSLRPSGRYAESLTVKPGEFILGYPNEFGNLPASPSVSAEIDPGNPAGLRPHPEAPMRRFDFGRNGTYLVLRQLQQHVDDFDAHIARQADALGVDPELLAAKLVGRWRSGAPLVMAPEKDDPALALENGFAFHEEDRHGLRCPLGSHVRRANPRDALADERIHVTPATSAKLVNRHRLIRRGRLYGPPKGGERGLLFICLNTNIQRQFEFVQQHWINGAKFGGLLDERDPLLGEPRDGARMTIQGCPVSHPLERLPRFVTVRGGAYFFLPGLSALRYLASLPNPEDPVRPRARRIDVPEFQPRFFSGQADLQTVARGIQMRLGIGRPDFSKLARAEQELAFGMNDGTPDALIGLHQEPVRDPGPRPLALLIHGLPGSQDSGVVVHTAASLLRGGYPVLRLNLRGAGPSQGRTRELYHAGRSADLHRVLSQLPEPLARNGVVVVAYSLGANLMLKALGEPGLDPRVRAAVSVAAPLDLDAMARHLHRVRGYRRLLYVRYLLGLTVAQVLKLPGLTPAQRAAIQRARTFFEFDRDFLAEFSGFRDVDAYYGESASRDYLPGIAIPTLLIHAPNDPIVPAEAYRDFAWPSKPNLRPLLFAAGGHAGFHGRGSPLAWHDRCIHAFLGEIAKPPPSS